jgi:Fe-S oxidoreductase
LSKTDLGFSIQAYGEYLFEKWVPKFLLSPISGYKIVQYFLPPLFRYTILPKFDKNFGLQNLGVEFWNESKDVEKAVILTFESSLLLFHTSMLKSCIHWLKVAGWTPYLAKPHANGKSLLNKGRVDWFQSLHQDTHKFYACISRAKIPVLCLDPGLFPTYKDLGIDVQYFPFWAKSNLKPQKNDFRDLRVTMVSHCVEHSLDAFSDWHELFAKWGVQLVHKPLGCCGMAGTWGLEKRNRRLFRNNFIKNWLGHFSEDDIIVNGTSCIGACQNFDIKNVMSPYEWVESNILNYPKL